MNSRSKQIALSLVLAALSSPALALPTGATVTSGSANFSQSGGTLSIVQNTNNAIINWQGFSIGAGETARFIQPSSSSIALNRVVTANPSSILGSLVANGSVFIVNANGILFGAGSQVAVGGLILSTSSITDANFLAGSYAFSGGGSASITLDGSIVAPAGISVFSGGTTSLTGTLTTAGTVSIPGQVVVGGGVAVVTGGSITLGGTTTTGSLVLTGSGKPTGIGPIKIASTVRAIPLAGAGNIALQGGVLAPSGAFPAGAATATLNLVKREVGF